MNLGPKVLTILDVVLRVPPLFVVDHLFMSKFGQIPYSPFINETADSVLNSDWVTYDPDEDFPIFDTVNNTANLGSSSLPSLESPYVSHFFWLAFYLQCLVISATVFLLPTKSLFALYLWLSSIAIVSCSYLCNQSYIHYVANLTDSSLVSQMFQFSSVSPWLNSSANYFAQIVCSLAFCYISLNIECVPFNLPRRLAAASFIAPIVISILPSTIPLSSTWVPYILGSDNLVSYESLYSQFRLVALAHSPEISLALAAFYIIINFIFASSRIITRIISDVSWCRTVANHYGLYTLSENQWVRLHVPQVLRVFWLTRVAEQAVMMYAESTSHSFYETGVVKFNFNATITAEAAKALITRGCETTIAVFGMTSVISSISHQFGCVIQWFLAVEDPEDRNIGTVSAILFFILSLQTGITGLEPEKRFIRLYKNMCLLFTAILHFVHNMVNPLLNSLSASRNMSIKRHARALTVCILLIAFPAWFLQYLCYREKVSTWLLAVSAFCIEVIIKVIISLLIYTLFMIDAFRTTVWEPLDDYVYVIKATGSSVEFIFGIFLFLNGAWILLFESGGTVRAVMMCIHAYFNIWLQAKQGWQKFIRRRNAVHKINSFPEATEQQLRDFDDICAICYQEMTSARITHCRHYFHGVCLRKWLYVQDICPLCHEELCIETTENKNNSNNEANNVQNTDDNFQSRNLDETQDIVDAEEQSADDSTDDPQAHNELDELMPNASS